MANSNTDSWNAEDGALSSSINATATKLRAFSTAYSMTPSPALPPKILTQGARAIDPTVLMPSNRHIFVFPQAISELQRQYAVPCQPLSLTSTPLLRTYPIILWISSPDRHRSNTLDEDREPEPFPSTSYRPMSPSSSSSSHPRIKSTSSTQSL
ncbi:hypothetical protein BS47DRAFT_43559 [Hydnum rufescens UP504]|uniref:Uncharacterized protein n=1 Tax=Hydnum rufescens UP504 TaxID=1448309 RepID=A0A9P6DTN4_9AGAM|nr:hypothetical protein BS47DRAFT_43559 [Hydnum rufescens UP504]